MFQQFSVKTALALRDFFQKYAAYGASEKTDERLVAVFDADGTLWRGDIGDRFLEFQSARGLLKPTPDGRRFEDLYNEYLATDREDEAFELLIQWNEGATEAEMRARAIECFNGFEANAFPPLKELVEALHHVGFEVWAVSASPWWIVSHGVKGFGIPEERVVAGKTRINNGRLTREFEYPFPYKAGKVQAIEAVIGAKPQFVAGNSMGDFEMMNLASELVLVMNSAKPGDPYYDTEQAIKREALARQTGPVKWVIEQVVL